MSESKKISLAQGDSGQRLDIYLSKAFPDHSRAYIQKLIGNGSVRINGVPVSEKKHPVRYPSEIEIEFPSEPDGPLVLPESFSFPVLFEDDDIMVIDKPPGVVVHPASGNWSGTVVNALLGRDSSFAENFASDDEDEMADAQRPGIVHRLDKDTSGCLIIAKNPRSKFRMSESFASGKVRKEYAAITYGAPRMPAERIVTMIGRHPVNRKKMSVVEDGGKEAVTIYEVVRKGMIDGYPACLLKVRILTGRTHQIRVHLAWKKIPVLGDKVYGGNQRIDVPRQMLHAARIEFEHPASGKIISVESPYPEDFAGLLARLK